MPPQNSEWHESERIRKKEWKTTWEIWEQMGQETAGSQLGDMEADPPFSDGSVASKEYSHHESIHNCAFHPSDQLESSGRTWPMSPHMLAVETATRELLEFDEHIEVLQLPPVSQDFLFRRISNVAMRTAAAPRYVSFPFRYRNSGPGLSLPTETPMFKLIEIEEGDSMIYDPPLRVIQGSNEHHTFAIICKLLDTEAAQISD